MLVLHPAAAPGTADLPVSLPGTNVGNGLPLSTEPSGCAWHPSLQRLFVVGDAGKVSSMKPDGTDVVNFDVPGNWEAVAVAHLDNNFVYLMKESQGIIREFNFVTGTKVRDFNLLAATPAPGSTALDAADLSALTGNLDNLGVEALAFVRDTSDPEGGLFYAGSQENGYIYRFRLSLSGGNSVTYLDKFRTWPLTDTHLSDLAYDWYHGLLIAIWDDTNMVRTMKPDGTILHEWKLPTETYDQEGVAFDGYSLYIAQDFAPASDVLKYGGFPIDRFTLTYLAGSGGTISGTTPQTVEYGWPGTEVVATPNTGRHFVAWSDGVATAARTDTNNQANLTATASFAINKYTVRYVAGPNGAITGTLEQVVDYDGSTTSVHAVATSGYRFSNWSDGSTNSTRKDTHVSSDITVTANFVSTAPVSWRFY